MGKFEAKRSRIRRRAQHPPWSFSRGLAHLLATVAEPRSDESSYSVAFNAYIDEHRMQLIGDIDELIASVNDSRGVWNVGGQVEDVLDRAAKRLMHVALAQGMGDVTERLERLKDERHSGVSDTGYKAEGPAFTFDFTDIPRSTGSNRRVGMWR